MISTSMRFKLYLGDTSNGVREIVHIEATLRQFFKDKPLRDQVGSLDDPLKNWREGVEVNTDPNRAVNVIECATW